MLRRVRFTTVYTFFATISWILLTQADFFSFSANLDKPGHESWLVVFRTLLLGVFFLSVFLFYKVLIGKQENVGFMDLLFRNFLTNAICIGILTLLRLSETLGSSFAWKDKGWIVNVAYHLALVPLAIIVGNTFFVMKKMILYHKTRKLLNFWDIYEYLVICSVLLMFLGINPFTILFWITFVPIMVFSLIIAFNVKWIAYLNYKLKWRSIIYALFMVFTAGYAFYFLSSHTQQYDLKLDLMGSIFLVNGLCFTLFYGLVSLLVIVFNLPTSSVFEQKFVELINFKKLSESIRTGKREEEIYSILMESGMTTLLADGSALEIYPDDYGKGCVQMHQVTDNLFWEIKTLLRKNGVRLTMEFNHIKDITRLKGYDQGNTQKVRNVITFPIKTFDDHLGTLYFFSEIKNHFENEMIEVVRTYVDQASLTLSNFRLIAQAVKNARYKEELEIAKKVQESLLPKSLLTDARISVEAFSHSAAEVGGDYYDLFQVNEDQVVFIIGDVSGNGTSAAFQMAQLKGVFQSLAQLGLNAKELLVQGNEVLSRCLDKASFITAAIVIINLREKKWQYSRAGHCPVLYFVNERQKAHYFEDEGIGLGIIRKGSISGYLSLGEHSFTAGDSLLLFTDGIPEAKDQNGEEFGYKRLLHFFEKNHSLPANEFRDNMLAELNNFSGLMQIHDDFTWLKVRFL